MACTRVVGLSFLAGPWLCHRRARGRHPCRPVRPDRPDRRRRRGYVPIGRRGCVRHARQGALSGSGKVPAKREAAVSWWAAVRCQRRFGFSFLLRQHRPDRPTLLDGRQSRCQSARLGGNDRVPGRTGRRRHVASLVAASPHRAGRRPVSLCHSSGPCCQIPIICPACRATA